MTAEAGLELFSGQGLLTQAFGRKCHNLFCCEIDVRHGPQFDLRDKHRQREIVKLLLTHRVRYVWINVPQSSWTAGCRLRDITQPLFGSCGLSLSGKDQHTVDEGNNLLRFCAKVFRICMRLQLPVALAAVDSSRIWLTPTVQHLLQHAGSSQATLPQQGSGFV